MPSGFQCTFEEGLCDEWWIFPRDTITDPLTNMTETFNTWMVIQGPTISLLTGPKHDHTLKVIYEELSRQIDDLHILILIFRVNTNFIFNNFRILTASTCSPKAMETRSYLHFN